MLFPVRDAHKHGFKYFALAITSVGDSSTHSGMLYSGPEGQPFLLHLADDLDLRNAPPGDRYFWLQSTLNQSRRKLMAALCQRIPTSESLLRYGFDRSGIKIDASTGTVTPGVDGKGLTCASFILAFFEVFGLRLLREDEWPTGVNRAWVEASALRIERQGNSTDEHLEALRSDVGASRFTPEEVVGASGAKGWPVGYADATAYALDVIVNLVSLLGK